MRAVRSCVPQVRAYVQATSVQALQGVRDSLGPLDSERCLRCCCAVGLDRRQPCRRRQEAGHADSEAGTTNGPGGRAARERGVGTRAGLGCVRLDRHDYRCTSWGALRAPLVPPRARQQRGRHRAGDRERRERRVGREGHKTHQHRRIVLDEETTGVLREHRALAEAQAEELGVRMDDTGYVFSLAPDHGTFLDPSTTTHRFERMARRLGIDSTLHKLRHYSATELLNAGVNIRAVAGRLGHGGGGATTLRVYAAWLAEADQRAAPALAGRMPARPAGALANGAVGRASSDVAEEGSTPRGPYIQIARDLRGAIRCGALGVGDVLPPVKDLARRYGVAAGTAHRAIALLAAEGFIRASRGRRPVVLDQEGTAFKVKSGATESPRGNSTRQG
ncbi:tyrosine-type recombinase/integrase [Kribbella sp. NPDC026596]|uniref:tyrosine-type recombinase/integrase n=1 Tax=Kribbella sp. NPDC026596 TaxID=3155122 RepID=UPI0033EFC8B2